MPKDPELPKSAKKPMGDSGAPQSSSSISNTKQQYSTVDRVWSTSMESRPGLQGNAQSRNSDTTTARAWQAGAQYMTPMERWEKENLRQSPWNNISSYATSASIVDGKLSKNHRDDQDDWSMVGNAKSSNEV